MLSALSCRSSRLAALRTGYSKYGFDYSGAELVALQRRRAIGGKHRAREIERAGNEDARRRRKAEAADRGERGLDVIGALRGNADRARPLGDRGGGEDFLLTGNRHRHHAAGERGGVVHNASELHG